MKYIIGLLAFSFWQISFCQNCTHTNLSDQFNIQIQLKKNAQNNPDYDSLYLKISIQSKDNRPIQTIRKNIDWFWDEEYNSCKNVRSYSKKINHQKQVSDNDYGDLIIADLNFDGKDDFAIINASGGNSGPIYHFYFQKNNCQFERNVFLSEKMIHFPTEINTDKLELRTLAPSGANAAGERIFAMNPTTKKWYLKSSRLITD